MKLNVMIKGNRDGKRWLKLVTISHFENKVGVSTETTTSVFVNCELKLRGKKS